MNSFHHQGIRNLAPGLKVSALSPDGLAEGLEQEAGMAGSSVQWHRRVPPRWNRQTGLFQALVRGEPGFGRSPAGSVEVAGREKTRSLMSLSAPRTSG